MSVTSLWSTLPYLSCFTPIWRFKFGLIRKEIKKGRKQVNKKEKEMEEGDEWEGEGKDGWRKGRIKKQGKVKKPSQLLTS